MRSSRISKSISFETINDHRVSYNYVVCIWAGIGKIEYDFYVVFTKWDIIQVLVILTLNRMQP